MLLILLVVVLLILLFSKAKFENTIQLSPIMTQSKINNLKKAQLKMTNMLYTFDSFCNKYNLKYWCIGGTFIGVIRHGGWIPWDGDVDVGMLNDDYIVLKKHIASELPKTMWFQDKDTDKLHLVGFGKIRDLYSNYTNSTEPRHHGLQLDIFPYTIENDKIFCASNDSPIEKEFYYSDIFPVKRFPFENIEVSIANNYEKVSIDKYSKFPPDLPPVEKRYPHEGDIDPDNPQPIFLEIYKDLY
jgi:phosphorylcholine metabolism protein LicD